MLYGDAGYREFLRSVLTNCPVLYLGFSFTDAYLNELRSEALALVGYQRDHGAMAYAVVNDAAELTRDHLKLHEGMDVLTFDSAGRTAFTGFDDILRSLYENTNPSVRLGRLLGGKRLLWLDPNPRNNEAAERFLAVARRAAVGASSPIHVERPATFEEAVRQLASSKFDLVITHWGEGENGALSTAELLLRHLRAQAIEVPAMVFAMRRDPERKRRALALGAQAYTTTYDGLLRTLERVFEPEVDAAEMDPSDSGLH